MFLRYNLSLIPKKQELTDSEYVAQSYGDLKLKKNRKIAITQSYQIRIG